MIESEPISAPEQVEILADLYSRRARAYDNLWSPVIRPLGEGLLGHLPLSSATHVLDVGTGSGALLPVIRSHAPGARVLGVDRSEGMLQLAREKHNGPLRLMDAQKLDLPDRSFDVAVVAFVLFHLPDPQRCLKEVFRVLRPGGWIGTATWSSEEPPAINAIWDEELLAAGAPAIELPATESRARCDSAEKVSELLKNASFSVRETWVESIEHQWAPEDHFRYQLGSSSRARLESLNAQLRESCLTRIRERLAGTEEADYTFRGKVILATARREPLRSKEAR